MGVVCCFVSFNSNFASFWVKNYFNLKNTHLNVEFCIRVLTDFIALVKKCARTLNLCHNLLNKIQSFRSMRKISLIFIQRTFFLDSSVILNLGSTFKSRTLQSFVSKSQSGFRYSLWTSYFFNDWTHLDTHSTFEIHR